MTGDDEAKSRVHELWAFVRERDLVRLKRENKLPPPWTDDELLASYHFPNVHRRHDPGSRWFADAVDGDDARSVLVKAYAYRMLNRLDVFQDVGLPEATPVGAARWEIKVDLLANAGRRIGSKRHQTFWSRVPRGLHALTTNLFDWRDACWVEDGVEAVTNLCGAGIGLGPFFAIQVVADLAESGKAKFDRLTRVPVSGGSRFGLDLCFGRATPLGMVDTQNQGRDLRRLTVLDRDLDELTELFESQPKLSELMTYVDIEHSLCEFGRYTRAKHGHLHNMQRRSW